MYEREKGVLKNSRKKPEIRPRIVPTNNNSSNDTQSRLYKLKKFLDAGLITKEEAAEKRNAILDSL
jgi:hypothetical protein